MRPISCSKGLANFAHRWDAYGKCVTCGAYRCKAFNAGNTARIGRQCNNEAANGSDKCRTHRRKS
jgi:hypothetical protein